MTEREIFAIAAQKPTAAERAACLDEACGADLALRQRIESLLCEQADLGSFLESPPAALAASPFAPTIASPEIPEKPGKQIGPYKLLEQIGEGGFGIVFMAEQQQPVRRKVALKVLKPGMDTRQVIARFEAERQALALMDHPNIAKVLDAGATDSGRPYFVMELVRGVPITEYCDGNQLTPRERLELFIPVCHAVQHAHQKGIIHRDIKPSNVLVTKHDGAPVVKVIDFGVAKALGQQLTDKTLFTGFAQMIGTPLYMSPEQAELSGLDIDTRTDIYSLGVLLYELLTGTTPFDKERLKSAAFDEIRRMIREEEPPKPSTRLSDLNSRRAPRAVEGNSTRSVPTTSLASVAALRKMEPRKLSQLVRGDLDWIVMKALEKDRNRRYETASGFALDIQRYLADEPVAACPPSALYRFRKFARRNKAGFAIATTVTAALLIAVVALAVSNALVRQESDAKEQALKDKDEALGEKTKALGAKDEALSEAKTQEARAKQNAAAAEEQRSIASKNEIEAKAQESLARRRFYAAQMNLAQQAWDNGNPVRVLELLENQRPRFDQEDLRGFEWYYLWRLCHRQRRFMVRHAGVERIAVSPDGKLLASGSSDSLVKIWDLASGEEQVRSRRDSGGLGIGSLVFSPDSATLAAGVADGTILLWDVPTMQARAPIRIHNHAIRSLSYSPDGKVLAAGTDNGRRGIVKLWDLTIGRERATLEADGQHVDTVSFSPDSRILASYSPGIDSRGIDNHRAKLWDLTGDPPRLTREWEPGGRAVFLPDGKTLAAGLWEVLDLRDVATGRTSQSIVLQASVTSLAVSPDGGKVGVGLSSRELRLWEPAAGRQSTFPHRHRITCVAFTPDGEAVATAGGDRITLWNMDQRDQEITLQAHDGFYITVAYAPDNKTLAYSFAEGVKLCDPQSGQERATIRAPGCVDVRNMNFSRDSRLLAVGRIKGPTIWDVVEMRELADLEFGGHGVCFMALAPDGHALAYGGEGANNDVHVWDIRARNLRKVNRYASSALYSSDSKSLVLGANVGLEFWNSTTLARQRGLSALTTPGQEWIFAMALSHDGRRLIVSGADGGSLKSLDSENGLLLATFKGHTASIRTLALFPDGKTLVSGSFDGTIKFWDMASAQERFSLVGHQGRSVTCVAVAPDGMTIASGGMDGMVRLWRATADAEASATKTELDPDEPDTPRDLIKVGDTLSANGRLDAAADFYDKAEERLSKLATAFPGEPDYRNERARMHFNRALLMRQADRLDESESHLRQAISIWEKLSADFPDRHLYRVQLVDAVISLASLLSDAHRAEAVDAMLAGCTELAVDLCTRLSAAGDRDLLAHRLWNLADVLSSAGRNDEAERTLRRAAETFEGLAAGSPGNFWYRQEQGFAHWRVGWLMNQIGRPRDAEEPFRRALATYRQLAQDAPQVGEYHLRLGRGYTELLSVLWNIGPDDEAARLAQEAVNTLSQAAREHGDVPATRDALARFHHDLGNLRLARIYNELATALARQGKRAEAEVEWDKAAAEYTKAIDLNPRAWEPWSGRAFIHFHRQQWEAAVADFSKAVELAPQVHTNWWHRGHAYLSLKQWDKAAADFGTVVEKWPDNAEGWYRRAQALARLNEPEKALADLRQAIARGFDSADPALLNNLAWLLATCPEATLRDPQKAVELAAKAVNLRPAEGTFRNTLGAARYRAGEWAATVEALNKSMELRQGGDAFDWFFLAMAEWQRGNKDEARQWYDKAAAWRAEKARDDEELVRFEAEARELLEGKD